MAMGCWSGSSISEPDLTLEAVDTGDQQPNAATDGIDRDPPSTAPSDASRRLRRRSHGVGHTIGWGIDSGIVPPRWFTTVGGICMEN